MPPTAHWVAAAVAALLAIAGAAYFVAGTAGSAEPCDGSDVGTVVSAPPRAPRVGRLDGRALGDPALSGMPWPQAMDVAPTVADLDGDGRPELVAHGNDRLVHVFAADGRVLARIPTDYPADWHVERILNGVAVGRLEPGAPPSLVIANHAACVAAWQAVPGNGPGGLAFAKRWETRLDLCLPNPGMDAKATLADLDGDGTLEILAQAEEQGLYALRANGTVLWHHCWGGGNADAVADDLDGDGRMEAIFASDAGVVAVFDGARGKPLWTFDAARHVRPASISVAPTVAQLDGRGEKELLFTARNAPSADPDQWPRHGMAVFAVHRDGGQARALWVREPEWAHPLSYTRLAVLDADRDGRMDILGMDWNTIGHSPGHWERLGPAHAFRLDASGNDVWVRELDTWWSNKDVPVVDLDGDGRMELVASAPMDAGSDGLVSLDVETGRSVRHIPLPGWQVMRGPVPADLRGDGTMQLVVPVSAHAEARGALLILDFDVPYAAPWKGTP